MHAYKHVQRVHEEGSQPQEQQYMGGFPKLGAPLKGDIVIL